jgi:3-deoxy-D-manno-octulosonate 8-phosphate phosphatase (KDO 8-P phosphatase)
MLEPDESERHVEPDERERRLGPDEIRRRAARVKLLLLDCDGVLTDGRITLLDEGDEEKSFHTRDGHGLVLLHRAGLQSGVISGRTSTALARRARDLGIRHLRQGTHNKIVEFREVLEAAGISEEETAYVGDDVTDIPLMRRCGLAIAVADATQDTRAHAHYVTRLPGGFGAVREVCELILKAQDRWTDLVRRYTEEQG